MGRREDRPSNEQQLKDVIQLGIGTYEVVHRVVHPNPPLMQARWKRMKNAAGPDERASKGLPAVVARARL